jgi:hypothetical protein
VTPYAINPIPEIVPNRRYLFSAVAQAMGQILVDDA